MDDKKSVVQIVRECYSAITPLRAAVQVLPLIGGSVDTLMLGRMAEIQLTRLEEFVRVLALRLKRVERSALDIEDEAFADLISGTFQKVTQTRSSDKRARFAQIIANQVASPRPWDEAETAVRLLSELEEIHMAILGQALGPPVNAPMLTSEYPIISPLRQPLRGIDETAHPILHLPVALPEYTELAIRMACHDLFARGLLWDTGIGKWDGGSMQQLSASNLANWFAGWIKGQDA